MKRQSYSSRLLGTLHMWCCTTDLLLLPQRDPVRETLSGSSSPVFPPLCSKSKALLCELVSAMYFHWDYSCVWEVTSVRNTWPHAETPLRTITELWQTQKRPDEMLSAPEPQALSTPIPARPGRNYQEESTSAKSFSSNLRNDVTYHAISAHTPAGTALRLCDGFSGALAATLNSEGSPAKCYRWALHPFPGEWCQAGRWALASSAFQFVTTSSCKLLPLWYLQSSFLSSLKHNQWLYSEVC